ncbi:pyridoxamine 5'-phosphate oxidase family protein [Aquitalea magnusonii]|uniref:Putative pyridoxine 5'-phosphate oxidase superfamily flavin-nucleotide-binding protein n=1 Tax=Aquitalea magnusonii TaxID=332411 RepID=A0A318JEN9_9NEIS|nr:pyridoxamine 5'-phosphate oxidase family protein [Aquitalea magnusonii]PXX45628.1 putative pyridoxine 5'-phosphate oxidase superfamily flavin-nucleotide-binding protein [Aquitalea magnusonii]
MGQRYPALNDGHVRFIEEQHLFFVATAMADGRVNLSPKGMDALRVLSPERVLWLNVTGSGNETATHLQHNPRMTLMFCAFAGKPLILRLYGQARAIHQGDAEWEALAAFLPALPGARQLFDLTVELVQSSCGMSVPFMDYQGEREQLNDWAKAKGPEGIRQYWQDRNQTSLDGVASGIVEKSRQQR